MYPQDLFGSKIQNQIKSNKLQHGKAGLPSSNLSFLCKLVFLNLNVHSFDTFTFLIVHMLM